MTTPHDPSELAPLEDWLRQWPDPDPDPELVRIVKQRVRCELDSSAEAVELSDPVLAHVQAAVRTELRRVRVVRLWQRSAHWLLAAAVLAGSTLATIYWRGGTGRPSAPEMAWMAVSPDLLALEEDLSDLELGLDAMQYVLFEAPPDETPAEIEDLIWPGYHMNF